MAKKNRGQTACRNGLKILMESPANPLTPEGLSAFREMKKAAGMDTHDMIQYIGKKSSVPRKKSEEQEKQDSRLQKLNS